MPDHLSPFGWGPLVRSWTFHPGWTVVALLLLGGYFAAVGSCRRHPDGTEPVRVARMVLFVAGVLLLLATVSSAIDTYSMSVFWLHMIEHLVLIMVVPALLVLGRPLSVVRSALAEPGRARFDQVMRSGPIAVLTHPLTGLGLYAIVIISTHLTGFMDSMSMHPWLMTAEQVLYVGSGWLLLLTLIGGEPVRWNVPYLPRVMLLIIAMVPDTAVGVVLLQGDHVLFPMMMSMHPSWAPDPVHDQQIAGGLMWAGGDGLMMFIAIGVVIAMIADPHRERVLGPWLESVRRQTMADHLTQSGGDDGIASETDVDSDQDVLDAYNRMLTRLTDQQQD